METLKIERSDLSFEDTINKIMSIIHEKSIDNDLRRIVFNIIGSESITSNDPSVPAVIHKYIMNNIKYLPDIFNVETLQSPMITLENKFGDCDDHVILFCCMLKCIGYDVGVCALEVDFEALKIQAGTNGTGTYNHICSIVNTSEGYMFSDTTNQNESFGWQVPFEAYKKRYIMFFA